MSLTTVGEENKYEVRYVMLSSHWLACFMFLPSDRHALSYSADMVIVAYHLGQV
jgi:hypothetical protein